MLGRSSWYLGLLLLGAFSIWPHSIANEPSTVVAEGVDVAGILSRHPVVTGSFTQSQQLPGIAEDLFSSGTFVYITDDRLLWHTLQPFESERTFSRRPSAGDRAGSSRQMSRMLLDLLNAKVLKDRRFAATVSGDAAAWQLNLTPKRRSILRHIQKVSLSGGQFVERILLTLGQGQVTAISFHNVSGQAAWEGQPSRHSRDEANES